MSKTTTSRILPTTEHLRAPSILREPPSVKVVSIKDPLIDGVLAVNIASTVCHTKTAKCEVLELGTCFVSSSTCATGTAQTANEFCMACAAVSGSVSWTCSSLDAN